MAGLPRYTTSMNILYSSGIDGGGDVNKDDVLLTPSLIKQPRPNPLGQRIVFTEKSLTTLIDCESITYNPVISTMDMDKAGWRIGLFHEII